MSDAFDSDDGQVGYRKPPVHTRFKPGQSGNPKGRPKGPRNLATGCCQSNRNSSPIRGVRPSAASVHAMRFCHSAKAAERRVL